MKTHPVTRQLIIEYLKANDSTFAKTNFANCSLTRLVIIKSVIEVNKLYTNSCRKLFLYDKKTLPIGILCY